MRIACSLDLITVFRAQAMRAFIEANFKMMDIDGDGLVGVNEFRYNCIQRIATDDIQVVDEAFNQLLNVSYEWTLSRFLLHDNLSALLSTHPVNWKSFARSLFVSR